MLKLLGARLAGELISEPKKLGKTVAVLAAVIFAIIFMFFLIPVSLITSVPLILFGVESSMEDDMIQQEILAYYQDAPYLINNEVLEWVEGQKDEYSWCDDIRVEYDFDLNWQDIIAIDAVRLQQDFTNTNKTDVLSLAGEFVKKDVKTKTYEVKETYYVTIIDEEGNEKRERRTRTVTKHRAVITVDTETFYDVVKRQGFGEEELELAENFYKNIIALDLEGNLNLYDNIDLEDLKQYPPGNANIVYYHQADVRWALESYGSSTILSGGCGPTALAMVVASYKNPSITPSDVARWSVANGHRAEGRGSYWSLIEEGGRHYGFKVEAVCRQNPEKIIQALSKGYPVIAAMGRGHFTRGGHFIVLRGLTEDGKILVNDPASVKRSNQAWDIGIIINESSTNAGINGCPFWILKP